MKFGWNHDSFLNNGRLAMLSVIVMIGTYLTTGQIIPGIF